VRFICTIYSQTQTFAGTKSTADGDRDPDGALAKVVVSGASQRDAAARAYVECVGRQRARLLREKHNMPRRRAAQESNRKAIAASLRKTKPQGSCYLLDNFVEGWLIAVEPVVPMPASSPLPRRLRLPHPLLVHLSRIPLSN
jgi:hypothetical protein